MKFLLIFLAALTAACSAHPPRVDCGAHLTPINTPAALPAPTTMPKRSPAKVEGR